MFKSLFLHKRLASALIILTLGGGYFAYGAIGEEKNLTRYATAAVEKGMIITSVTGSGQVSSSDQIDVKPKVSGEIIKINVKNGESIKAGDILFEIDDQEAQKAVRDASTDLEIANLELEDLLSPPDELPLVQAQNAVSEAKRNLQKLIDEPDELSHLQSENALKQAKRDLDKLLKPIDPYDLMQAENSLKQAQDNLAKLKLSQETDYQKKKEEKAKAEDNLNKAYEDSFNAISNAFLDFPSIVSRLKNILFSTEIADSVHSSANYTWNTAMLLNVINLYERDAFLIMTNSTGNIYEAAREKYDEIYEKYKNNNRDSSKEIIVSLMDETIETAKLLSDTVKSESNMLDYWSDKYGSSNSLINTKVAEYQTELKAHTSKVNTHLSSLLAAKRSLDDYKEAIINADRNLKELDQNNPLDLNSAQKSVKEKEEFLADLKAGADDDEIEAAEEKVKEKEKTVKILKAGADKDEIKAATENIKEKELTLAKLVSPADEIEVKSKKINVRQKKDALTEAQKDLNDCQVKAPFDGIIGEINIKKGDTVTSATSAITLISNKIIAEIVLNEVDVAKVKLEQKATVTFDALDELTLTGKVAEIDTLGAVSQGVVTYNIKITLDVQDERIKQGMSLSATIITNSKNNVLLVPNSAIKQDGEINYVAKVNISKNISANITDTVSASDLDKQYIEIGLSNDTVTEVVNGLNEADYIVTQTITTNAQSQTKSSGGGFAIPGMGGQAGGSSNREFRQVIR